MVGALYAFPVGHQLLIGRRGGRCISCFTPKMRYMTPGLEGVWVVGAEHAFAIG
ncbi:hypothetical protein SCHAM137S_00409 [Streptomyces chartreusis]